MTEYNYHIHAFEGALLRGGGGEAMKHVFENFHIEGCFFEGDLFGGKGCRLNTEDMVC